MTGPKNAAENRELPPLGQGVDGEIAIYPPDRAPVDEPILVVGADGEVRPAEEEIGEFEDGADL